MDVVIARAMHQQQRAMQLSLLWHAIFVALGVLLWQPHVTLGVNGVIVLPVRHGCNRFPALNSREWVSAYSVIEPPFDQPQIATRALSSWGY